MNPFNLLQTQFNENKQEQINAFESFGNQFSKNSKPQTIQTMTSNPITAALAGSLSTSLSNNSTFNTPQPDTTPLPIADVKQRPQVAPVVNNTASNQLEITANKVAQPTPQPTRAEKTLTDLEGLLAKQGEQGERTLSLQEEQKLAEKQEQLNAINAEAIQTDASYQKQIDEVSKNTRGMSTAQLNAEVGRIKTARNRDLADIATRQAVAQGNVQLANQIIQQKIDAEFEPIKNQIESLKTFYNIYQNDLTASESKALDAQIRRQESDLDFARQKELLAVRQQYDLENMGIKSAVEAQQVAEQNRRLIPALQDKQSQLSNLIAKVDSGTGAVGMTAIGRISPLNFLTGEKTNFIADVEQLISQETLDTLINLKKEGGTLGALSEPERLMLQSAASKIGTWRQEKDGKAVGYKTTPEAFKTELETLKMITNRAIVEAGGTVNDDPLGIKGEDPLNLKI